MKIVKKVKKYCAKNGKTNEGQSAVKGMKWGNLFWCFSQFLTKSYFDQENLNVRVNKNPSTFLWAIFLLN